MKTIVSSDQRQLNGSAAKAFLLLECFTPSKPEWGITELAREVGSNKSTVYRLLASLELIGVVQKSEYTGRYSLGLKLFELGNRVNIKQAFIDKTHPELEKVAKNITETVHLGILKQNQVFMVDKVESPQGLKLNSITGSYSPVHCTALGKVLLSYSSQDQLKEVLDQIDLHPNTEFTITSRTKLENTLNETRINGFAIDQQELELGLICVAVPVFNQEQEVIASLSAAGPAIRFREDSVEEYVAILKEGATNIQKQIGNFRP